MSLPAYEAYKDCGVEWLGKVPRHWNVRRLKVELALLTEKAGCRSYPVALENIESWSGRFVATAGEFEGDGIAFIAGDILFGKLRPYLAKVYLADRAGEAVGDFHALRPLQGVDGRFVQYQMLSQSFIDVIDSTTFGSKMPRASWEALGNMPLVVPPSDEQVIIAAFLDRETAKIDNLIAAQRKLVDLLEEKKLSLISHAVTKGLNPDVPMKDSGVEGVGSVPTHWTVTKLKRCLLSIDQGWSPQCENFPVSSPDEWGVLKVGCVNSGQFDPEENKKLPEDVDPLQECVISKGDLLVSRANTRELVGRAAVVHDHFEKLLLCDKLYRLRTNPNRCIPDFVSFYMSTALARRQIESHATGASSSMLNISQSVVLDLVIALPSVAEQSEIMLRINEGLSGLSALSREATRAIRTLQERRSALISAAVTGKIDVRGLVEAPQEQQALESA